LQYTTRLEECVRCYANDAYNARGTHLSGLRAGLTRALKRYGKTKNLFENSTVPMGEDCRAGLTAVVSVRLPNPQFESAKKLRLNNPEIEGIVASVVQRDFGEFLNENRKKAERIIRQAVSTGTARQAKKGRSRKGHSDRRSK